VTRFRLRFIGALALTSTLLAIGTVGFALFPGWSLSDAFYMTVITLTSVGYQEVHPLDDGGRIFATFVLAGGVTTLGIWFALITSTLVELDLAHVFGRRRTMKAIEKLRGHVIVCGAGSTGKHVITELAKSRTRHVVLEEDPMRAEEIRQASPDAIVFETDATHDDALLEAGIRDARGLVAALGSDADNLFVCLTARDLCPNITIISRAYAEDTVNKLHKAGADHVVSPNITGGIRMASMLLRPDVMSFLDVVTRSDEVGLLLEQVPVPPGSSLAGHSLAEAAIPSKTGLVIVAIKHQDLETDPFRYNPGPDEEVRSGDLLIVLGQEDQIDRLRATLA